MGVLFVRASSTYLSTQEIPVTGYPFVMGHWVWMVSVGTAAQANVALSATGSTSNFYWSGINSAELPNLTANDGASTNTTTATTLTANGGWVYILSRFISTTNRRLAVLLPNGALEVASSAASVVPSASNILAIGADMRSGGPSLPSDCKIAEVFVANADILSADQNITRDNMINLAYNGPFANPNIAGRIGFYASLRDSVNTALIANRDSNGRLLPVTMTTSATSPTLCDHPPLSATYERPRQNTLRFLPV